MKEKIWLALSFLIVLSLFVGPNIVSFAHSTTPAPVVFCDSYGDVNLDGKITSADSKYISEYLAKRRSFTQEQKLRADLTQDGLITKTDAEWINNFLAGNILSAPSACAKQSPCNTFGDVTGNAFINLRDSDLLSKYINKKSILADAEKTRSDVTKDGIVDIEDLNLINQYIAGSISTFPVCQASCTETDGGKNYDVFGSMTGYANNPPELVTLGDCCSNGGMCVDQSSILVERFCDGNNMSFESYNCPNGCKNRACISAANPACTDTDGGLNYSVKGSVTGGTNNPLEIITQEDCCVDSNGRCVESSNQLVEKSCNGYWISHEFHDCPNGCFQGACVEPTTTP